MTLDRGERNDRLVDFWSFTHIAWGIGLTVYLQPWIALALLVLWEPLEILVLSPLFARAGFVFGHETIRNSLSDIVFDVIGVAIGALVVAPRLGITRII